MMFYGIKKPGALQNEPGPIKKRKFFDRNYKSIEKEKN